MGGWCRRRYLTDGTGKEVFDPRAYQQEAIDYALSDTGTPILCAPTGSGKTFIALWVAKHYLDQGKRAAIITPREEILNQFVESAEMIVGPGEAGVVKADWPRSPYRPLQICSWPTLRSYARRAYDRGRDLSSVLPPADVVIVDECHLSVSPQVREFVIKPYSEEAKLVGVTATPSTKTGAGLGSVYTSIKHVTSVRQLIKEGFLCPLEYFAGSQVDLSDVKVRNGDYVAKDLGKSVSKLVGDYVDNWLRIARDRHTIVFTPDKASCEGVAERYNEAGIRALALHSGKHPEKRHQIVEAFKRKDAQVLVNVGIASYGFDCPSVDCIQLLRNTKSIVLHLQQLGRGMRTFEGKTECLVLDHTRNVRDLGYADDLFRWRLRAGKDSAANWSRDPRSGEVKEGEEREPHECKNCQYLFQRRLDCPNCGLEIIPEKRDLETTNAKLVRISKARTGKPAEELNLPTGKTLFSQLLHIEGRRGYKRGWAARTYKDLHPQGYWPAKRWNDEIEEPEAPCHELLNKVNKRLAHLKIKQRARAAKAKAS